MKPRIAILLSSLADGGIGKMRTHLANEFARRGYPVDFLLGNLEGRYLARLDPAVRVIHLGTSHALTGVPRLAAYLWRNRPEVLLTQRVRVNVMALRARRLARSATRVYVTTNTNVSTQLASLAPAKRDRQRARMRRHYPRNHGIFAVSRGVADDTADLLGMPRERVRVLRNPTVTPALFEEARRPPSHPWFADGGGPVIMGMGRLEPQKDFATLMRAFGRLHAAVPGARLVIFGEGALRGELETLADELGIADAVDLPGFTDRPYTHLAHADVFVLSSRWEGSPNALTEAVALGTPVVATDCPDGPREILDGGRHAPLVPMGDTPAMAAAMQAMLETPPPRERLQAAAGAYHADRSARAYLEAMGLEG